MSEIPSRPQPDPQDVEAWVKRLNADFLHGRGWITTNEYYHALAIGARMYANERFANDPDGKKKFLDGVAFLPLAESHFNNVEAVRNILQREVTSEETPVTDDPPNA